MKQTDLFNQMDNGAVFSECRKYRYALWRIWNKNRQLVMFIGLNPSDADESFDDPTIRRVKRFAFDWGYGGVYLMNLFAHITPNPGELEKSFNPINDKWLVDIAAKCDRIIFAWGSFEEAQERGKEIIKMFDGYALSINKDRSPRHPLYVKKDVKPVIYIPCLET